MENETKSAPVQKLIEYSLKTANTDDVMRALTTYQNWLAPAMLFAGEPTRDSDGKLHATLNKPAVIFGTETNCPADELWIFTDRNAAQIAQTEGAKLGLYAYQIAGTELFVKFTPNLTKVRVNPSSPMEESWFFGTDSFELAQMWAKAMLLEESFSRPGKPDFKAISQYKYYTVFYHPNDFCLTLPNQCGMKNPLMVLTTPDCIDAFLAKMGNQPIVVESKQMNGDGLSLIKRFNGTDIDGMVINPFGPGKQTYFAFSEIEDVNAI